MINIFRKYFSPTFQSIQAIIFQNHSTLIWCLTTRCLRIFVVEVVDEKMVLQWLHIVVLSTFFMKCFQTSERPLEWRVFLVTGERPCGKYQSSRPRSWALPPLSSCISRSRVIHVSWFKIIKKGNIQIRIKTIQDLFSRTIQYDYDFSIWCFSKRCCHMYVVALSATKIVFSRGQRLHITLVFFIFFMKCFQTSERPCGKYQSCINRSRVICVSWFKIINKKGTFRVATNPYMIYSPESFNMIMTSQFGALVRGAATCM